MRSAEFVEMPAVNGAGTARAIAKVYGCAATGDPTLGISPDVRNGLEGAAEPPSKGLRDKVLHTDTSFLLGLVKPMTKFVFGSTDKAYGTPGAGGSFGLADPDTGVGFG